MAWQLVMEVLDHAPAGLTPAERLVLVALAEYSNIDDRRCFRSSADLQRRTGLQPSSLRSTYGRLAARGLDPRVPLEHLDHRGRPVFAHAGKATRFEVPRLPAPEGCTCQACRRGDATSSPLEGDATASPLPGKATPQRQEGDDLTSGRRRHVVAQSVLNREEPERDARPAEPKASTPDPTPLSAIGDPVPGTTGGVAQRDGSKPRYRCADHAHLEPHTDGPACSACGAVRETAKANKAASDRTFAEAARSRAQRQREADADALAHAIGHCGLCDDNGYRGGVLCHHRPELIREPGHGARLFAQAQAAQAARAAVSA